MTCLGSCTGHHQARGVHALARVGGPPEDTAWRESGNPCHPPEIDPSAWVNAFATVDAGTQRPTTIGPDAVILAHAHVGHDARVHEGAMVATGAIIGGHAQVGPGAKVGINATVLPFRTVGQGAEVGGGAVVTKDIPAGEVWAGNPARKIEAGKNPIPYTSREAA